MDFSGKDVKQALLLNPQNKPTLGAESGLQEQKQGFRSKDGFRSKTCKAAKHKYHPSSYNTAYSLGNIYAYTFSIIFEG